MKKIGLAALEQRQQQQQQYRQVGGFLAKSQAESLNKQLRDLQYKLEEYGRQHSESIRQSPQSRSEFAKLCGKIGCCRVEDSNETLATRIIEVCRATRNENGGVISVKRLQSIIEAQEGTRIALDKIIAAIKSLEPLGQGVSVETLSSGVQVIRSTMHELSTDQADVINACDALGFVSVPILKANLSWTDKRSQQCLDDMVAAGMLWIDEQADEMEYWSLGAFHS